MQMGSHHAAHHSRRHLRRHLTPTEAAVIATFYGIIVGIFVYKELSWKASLEDAGEQHLLCGGIMLTFAPAAAMGAVLSLLRVPQGITAFLFGISSNKIVVLLIVNVFLIFVGMVMDTTSANIIFSPILLMALKPYGIKPRPLRPHHDDQPGHRVRDPPVAANLFVASGMTGIPLDKIVRKAFPFIVAMFLALMIITYVPDTSIGLLKLLGRSY